jgi:hypothetical protein
MISPSQFLILSLGAPSGRYLDLPLDQCDVTAAKYGVWVLKHLLLLTRFYQCGITPTDHVLVVLKLELRLFSSAI